MVKTPRTNSGDARGAGLNPESERSPGEGNGNPLPYSCLENPWTEETGGLWVTDPQDLGSQRVGHD